MFRIFFIAILALASSAAAAVQPGIDVLAARDFAPLRGKRVGLVTNQTGLSASGTKTRVILKKHVNLVALYSPEHGIDGTVLAGKYVPTRKDSVTGLTVHSLYGPTRKPTAEMLKGVDILVYDMQDIGARCYTYISTMAKCMEACGENGIEFMVLDRPNPLGGERVEGPGIEEKWRSFVGQLPVPFIHGMTAGELAQMANSKGWAGKRCNLTVIPVQGWSRGMDWSATGLRWVQTSPNIPRASSVAYYAATGIFGSLEGCGCDVGIGTGSPFEIAGAAGRDGARFATHLGGCGISCSPYRRGEFAGARLSLSSSSRLNLAGINIHLFDALQQQTKGSIFARYRDADNLLWKIYGSTDLRTHIEKRTPPEKIIASWDGIVSRFRAARQPYLLYQ